MANLPCGAAPRPDACFHIHLHGGVGQLDANLVDAADGHLIVLCVQRYGIALTRDDVIAEWAAVKTR